MKSKCFNSFIWQFNDLKSNTTVSNFCLLLVLYCGFCPKNGVKFDDVTVTFLCIIMNFIRKLTLILTYQTLKIFKIECDLHDRKIGQLLFSEECDGIRSCHPPQHSLCLILGPRWQV